MAESDGLSIRRSWDTDKAIRSTYGNKRFGKYQFRSFVVLCVVFISTESWVSSLVHLNAIPPKSLQCINTTNKVQVDAIEEFIKVRPDIEDLLSSNGNNFSDELTLLHNYTSIESELNDSDFSHGGVLTPLQLYKDFNVSWNDSSSVLTEFGLLCGEEYKAMFARIGFIASKHVGSFAVGMIADKVGRKIPLLITSLVSVAMVFFQMLSEDFVSYCFFTFFVGLSVGGFVPVAIAYVLETTSQKSRGPYALVLLLCPCVADLIIPWIAYGVRSWKVMHIIAAAPATIAVLIYWWTEETAYYYVSLRQYIEAIESLTRIATFNGSQFASKFKEAEDFKRMKMTKGVQCDFQPLLRLQDIELISHKYPDVDFAELMESRQQKKRFIVSRAISFLGGKHYISSMTKFYVFDYIYSPVVAIHFIIFCAMWLLNGLTCSALESHELSWRMKNNPYTAFCYSAATSITAGILILPFVYRFSRRWTIFCSYLIVEVCLLASIVAKIEKEFTPITLTLIYLLGKVATFAVYLLTCIMCAEIFPTGLRCTSIGIGLLFRGIGLIIADPELLNFHDWTSRLIYGFLSLIIGSLALVLPETRKYLLPRSFKQIEDMQSTISKKFRPRQPEFLGHSVVHDMLDGGSQRAQHGFDCHSTMYTIYGEAGPRTNESNRLPVREGNGDYVGSQCSQNVDDEISDSDQGENAHSDSIPVHDPTQMVDIMQYRVEHDDAYFSENL
ncbi:hypothetical protein ACOME3_009371 [Neoechinorhynchus agilis]